MTSDEQLKQKAAELAMGTAIGASAGAASSILNTPTPHLNHQAVFNATAHGGRVATDAFRQSMRHSHKVLPALGVGAAAVGTLAAGSVTAAAAATTAVVVAAAPVVAVGAVVGAVGYGLYKGLKKIFD